MNRPNFRIALISPKGPLYRHRGGIFKQSLRYMPLTLHCYIFHAHGVKSGSK
jgi:hypothetical protein